MNTNFLTSIIFSVSIISSQLIFPGAAAADLEAFGGSDQRFKGEGDKNPPACQVEYPRGASSPFFIKWNCDDGEAIRDELRSEVWVYTTGGARGKLAGSFIGFPASLYVDENTVGSTDFTSVFPLRFRLLVTDRAGNAAVSPVLTVDSQDNSVEQCNLTLITASTQAVGSTTGIPSLSVVLEDKTLQTATSSERLVVTSFGDDPTSICEITSVCANGERISYNTTLSLSNTTASGTLLISPGNVSVEVSGTPTIANSILSSVEVSGTTTIDGSTTQVTLSCSK